MKNVIFAACFGIGAGAMIGLTLRADPEPPRIIYKAAPLPFDRGEPLPPEFWHIPRAHIPQTASADLLTRGDDLGDEGRHYLGPEKHRAKRHTYTESSYEKARGKELGKRSAE